MSSLKSQCCFQHGYQLFKIPTILNNRKNAIKDEIYAQVVDIDKENNKLKLSIKNIDYRNSGEIINDENYMAGFGALKDHLDDWINDKIKEIMDKM